LKLLIQDQSWRRPGLRCPAPPPYTISCAERLGEVGYWRRFESFTDSIWWGRISIDTQWRRRVGFR